VGRVSAATVPTLSEAESKALLARHGIPVPAEELVASPEEAAAAADRIGYPVVVKLCGPAIAHKTERGLVKLGLRDGDAVAAAADKLLAAARPEDGDVGLLVGAMVSGARELIAGFVRHDEFGPCVMLGIGGIFAEALGDAAFRLAPLDSVDADELIDDLSNRALLGALRGEPPVDRAALTRILLGLAEVGEGDERIRSIDLNPLIVSDGVPVAVDALVELGR
jgi:acetate---CoA ligase (ADP-forming) subunit beta